jgi:hypothetical protein
MVANVVTPAVLVAYATVTRSFPVANVVTPAVFVAYATVTRSFPPAS